MEKLEKTYCNNTDNNLNRYISNGFTYVSKFNSGEDYIIAYTALGREICYKVGKDMEGISLFKLIEDEESGVTVWSQPVLVENTDGVFADTFAKNTLEKITTDIKEFSWNDFFKPQPDNSYQLGDETKMYSHNNVIQIMEHLLSFQRSSNHYSVGSVLDTKIMIMELNKFGFIVNPNGKNIEGL